MIKNRKLGFVLCCTLALVIAVGVTVGSASRLPPDDPGHVSGPAFVGPVTIVYNDSDPDYDYDETLTVSAEFNYKGKQRTGAVVLEQVYEPGLDLSNMFDSLNSKADLEDFYLPAPSRSPTDCDGDSTLGEEQCVPLSVQLTSFYGDAPGILLVNTVTSFQKMGNAIIAGGVTLYYVGR